MIFYELLDIVKPKPVKDMQMVRLWQLFLHELSSWLTKHGKHFSILKQGGICEV